MQIVISSGHGKYIRGASGYLDEVDEARRVVEKVADVLRSAGVGVKTFHDDVSKTQSENLKRIVDFHNVQQRDLDISVHFNAYQTTPKPMGTECLYVTQSKLADDVAEAISAASGLIDRGPKKRTDLYFLNNTSKPAILIEVCFVDSRADADLYDVTIDQICQAIAETVSGETIAPVPPGPTPEPEPEPPSQKPMLRKGDEGPYVLELQAELNDQLEGCRLVVDGDFGSGTEAAVKDYQRSRMLDVDGIVGQQTWGALDNELPPVPPPPSILTADEQTAIRNAARNSDIYRYGWKDRGVAPPGYTEGMALAFAVTCRQFWQGVSWSVEMAKANTHNSDKDALSWYAGIFNDMGMPSDEAGVDTLRYVFVLMLGLGMRESSGRHCEGRDMSATNTSSDTAEAGLFQQSWNSSSCSGEMQKLMNAFSRDDANCYLDTFKQGVSCSSSEWSNYGSGDGAKFQGMAKSCPTFAAQCCGIGLRNLRQHWGPINRREAEVKNEADDLFIVVQDIIAPPAA
jgi:hypothetical protein